jgi:glycosyltransferase involved in cell wall biosynthesis
MIKIGIDGHMLGDHSGGNESYYTNILRNMDIPDNMIIYLFVNKGIDISEYKEKFKIIYFKSNNAFLRNFLELSILCKKLKLDLLHTQYFIPFIRPCKVVCTIHDICFEHFKNIFTKKEYFRQKILIPYAAKHSEYIFTVSNHAKGDIIKHYNISEEKVIVTYNAVNNSFHKMGGKELDSNGLRKKFKIGAEEYILSVCNLQPRKNLVRLIKAFVSIKKEQPERKEQLVIVGKRAWMFSDILQVALENSKDVIFTDYVNENDLVRLYNAAKVFIFPSFYEGFGIPPLEAMACGVPVGVSNATSLPEVVGDAGLYFDPFDSNNIKEAMLRLLDDTNLRHSLMDKNRDQVKRFNWKISSEKILETYYKATN